MPCALTIVMIVVAAQRPATTSEVDSVLARIGDRIASIPGMKFDYFCEVLGIDKTHYPDQSGSFKSLGRRYLWSNRYVHPKIGRREDIRAFDGNTWRSASFRWELEVRVAKHVSVGDRWVRPPAEDALAFTGLFSERWHLDLSNLLEFLQQPDKSRLEGTVDDSAGLIKVVTRYRNEPMDVEFLIWMEQDPPHRIVKLGGSARGPQSSVDYEANVIRFGEYAGVWYAAETVSRSNAESGKWKDVRRTVLTNFELNHEPIDFSELNAAFTAPNIIQWDNETGQHRDTRSPKKIAREMKERIREARESLANWNRDESARVSARSVTWNMGWFWVLFVASGCALLGAFVIWWRRRRT